jgi:hypothetical protein
MLRPTSSKESSTSAHAALGDVSVVPISIFSKFLGILTEGNRVPTCTIPEKNESQEDLSINLNIQNLEECESLRDKLIYSLCHAHEYDEQPERLRGIVFDRLFTVIKICNFTVMELEEYRARAMWKADRKAELDCARDEGREEVFALLDSGISLAEAKQKLGLAK